MRFWSIVTMINGSSCSTGNAKKPSSLRESKNDGMMLSVSWTTKMKAWRNGNGYSLRMVR